MGIIVFACYRPRPQCQQKLEKLVSEHVPLLRREKLATEREAIIAKCKDGSIVEVFEWRSQEAISAAHRLPAVKLLWDDFYQVCDIVPLSGLHEVHDIFAEFTPL